MDLLSGRAICSLPRSRFVSRHVTLYLLLLKMPGCRHPEDESFRGFLTQAGRKKKELICCAVRNSEVLNRSFPFGTPNTSSPLLPLSDICGLENHKYINTHYQHPPPPPPLPVPTASFSVQMEAEDEFKVSI